jgi:hypothetical protein
MDYYYFFARVVKLADTPDLGSGAVRREGSSPSPSTIYLGVPTSPLRFYLWGEEWEQFG